ncbi:MAG: DUF5667 domain-containing protein [Patescibacteria group bacterium]
MEYNKHFKKGIRDVQNISLTSEEKGSMLSHLTAYAAEHPVQSISLWKTIYIRLRMYKSAYALAFAAVLVIIGGNISYAAEQALPGDLLYPVKIHVNEAVQDAINVTPKASVAWEEKKIERRLDEAKALVQKGKFDFQKKAQVEKEVEKNVRHIRLQSGMRKGREVEYSVKRKLDEIHNDRDDRYNKKEFRGRNNGKSDNFYKTKN